MPVGPGTAAPGPGVGMKVRLGTGRGPLLAALGVVVLAHAPYLIGAFDPNPALSVSGLIKPGSHPLVPGFTSIDPNAGYTSQANGHRAALDWVHGRIPWWNPWEGAGSPLAGGLASAAFFLPFVLLTLIPNGQMLIYLLLDLIAAAATYGVLRCLGLHPWVCFAGAVLFGLNGTNAWFRYVADNPVAFLPVILLGIERTRRGVEEGRRLGVTLVALGVGFSLLASFPETAYLDGLVAVVWVLARSGGLGRTARWVIIRRTMTGMVAGVLIAAPLLVAFVDYYPHADLGAHSSAVFGTAFLPRAGLISLFAPYGLGPIFGFSGTGSASTQMTLIWGNVGGYLTVVTVFLAALGTVGRRHRALRWALAAVALILVGRNFGFAPAADLVNLLPLASSSAVFRYDNAAIEMAVFVLAALAIDDAVRRRPARWLTVAIAAVVVVVGALAVRRASALHHLLVGPHVGLWWKLSLLWAAGTGLVVVLAVVVGPRRFRALVLAGVVVVDAVLMFALPELSAPRGARLNTAGVAFLSDHVGTSRFFTLGPFAPNYGAYYGVGSANANDFPPKAYQAYVLSSLNPNAEPITFNGVNRLDPNGPSPAEEFATHLGGYRHLAVSYVLFFHGEAPPVLPEGALRMVYSDEIMDVYYLDGSEPYATAISAGCSVTIATTEAMSADCASPTSLLRREVMMPGWTATVNGRTTAPVASADGFQVVALPAGHSVVRFSFRPPGATLAWAACAAGILIIAGGPLWRVMGPRMPRRRGYQPSHRQSSRS